MIRASLAPLVNVLFFSLALYEIIITTFLTTKIVFFEPYLLVITVLELSLFTVFELHRRAHHRYFDQIKQMFMTKSVLFFLQSSEFYANINQLI